MLKGRHDGTTGARDLPIAAALFACLFAAQAAVLAPSLILTDVARSFGVSTASAGQLRTVSGLAAGVAALFAVRLAGNVGVRTLVSGGLWMLAGGAIASAAAPGFTWLVAAQALIGVGTTGVLAGGVAGAAAWPSPEGRARALSWALNGQPVAWVMGMPLIGIVAGIDWRLGWLAVPLGSALIGRVALRRTGVAGGPPAGPRHPGLGPALQRTAIRRWATGELLAYAAWTGTLVFVGALFVQSYPVSTAFVGLMLGAGAVAYVPGNLVARRKVDGSSAVPLVVLAVALAGGIAILGAVRPSPWFSGAVFTVLAFLAGARGYAGSVRGLALAPEERVAIGGLRAAATQFGYLVGSAVGGAALGLGGFTALGIALAVLSGLAVLPSVARPDVRSPIHSAFGGGAARPWAPPELAARMHHGR